MKPTADTASVYDAFRDSAARYAERPFLRVPAESAARYAGGPVELSYEQSRRRVETLVGGYADCGIGAGDRVAVAFDNRVEVYLHQLALNGLGASMVPLNSGASDDELHHMITHSDSRIVVSLPEYAERLAEFDICMTITEAKLGENSGTIERPPADLSREAALLYTSGTTGKPKGCIVSNEYFLALGAWYTGLGGICAMDENDRLLTPLSPNHMNALCTSFPAMMMCGGCVIQVDRFHPRSWWRTVREERATIVHCLGVMTAMLLTLPEEPDEDISRQIKFCFGPGSDPKHQGVFEKRFGVPLIEAWAMTESGAGGMTIACREPRHVGQRCIGPPIESMEHRIVDEADHDVPPGEPGELLVRARGDNPRKGFFSGYYKDDAATEEGWKGGWWHTGDVVREGEDGSLFFVDRRKNVIRRSGENIAAVEVEGVLLQHSGVHSCAVCAVPDEIRGDEVFAFVVPSGNADARGIFEHCMAHLTYFKAPGYIAFVPELPLTPSQKVSRGEVKKLAHRAVADGNCEDLRQYKKRTRTA